MNPIAFLLLLLLPTIAAKRPILPGTRSFDGATDGTFSVPVVRYALSTPLIKNQQTIILKGGTPRHDLRAAPGARHATVTDGTLKASNLNNGKTRCQNKNEGKNLTDARLPSFLFFFLRLMLISHKLTNSIYIQSFPFSPFSIKSRL